MGGHPARKKKQLYHLVSDDRQILKTGQLFFFFSGRWYIFVSSSSIIESFGASHRQPCYILLVEQLGSTHTDLRSLHVC